MRAEGRTPRVLVLDLDLHQGDGNAVAFAQDDEVLTVSVHEEDAFPFPKLKSDLDLGLPSSIGDRAYLEAVDRALAQVTAHGFVPDVVIYVAGTDPHVDDPLGTFQISRAAMVARDKRVATYARRVGCGLVALPAGGYTQLSPDLSASGFAAMAEIATL